MIQYVLLKLAVVEVSVWWITNNLNRTSARKRSEKGSEEFARTIHSRQQNKHQI
jgi:hypothetical protein